MIIDPDYRGQLIVALYNDSKEDQIIKSGDKIAQLLAMPRFEIIIQEKKKLDDTPRGSGGFGSTDE